MKDHNIEVFDPNKAILFRNWTNEEFSYKWANQPYTFQPGETRYFPEGLAHHFAKHLTDKMLTQSGKDVDDQGRAEMYSKCLIDGSITAQTTAGLQVEMMNQKAPEPVVEQPVPNQAVPAALKEDRMAKARAAMAAKRAAKKAEQTITP